MTNAAGSAYREWYEYDPFQAQDYSAPQNACDRIRIQNRAQWEKAEASCDREVLFRQKAAGWCFALAGAILPFLTGGDATCSLVLIPVGVCLIFRKSRAQ